MRKVMTWTLASTTLVAIACGRSKAPATAMSDDLKRDLKLASVTQNFQISPDEVTPASHKEFAVRPKKAPSGPKVIRTQHPTVKASAAPVEVAEANQNVPQVQVMAASPAPSETPTPDAPPMARPAPTPAPSYPSTGPVGNGSGNGTGSVIGGILGGIFRGGIDDDHCDPHGPRRRPVGGGVYGMPPGGIGGIGGIIGGGGRRGGFPIIPIARP